MPADSRTLHKNHGGITPRAPGPNTISTQGQKTKTNKNKVQKFPYTTYYTPFMQTKFVFQCRAMGRKEYGNETSHTHRLTHNQNINTM
jgi:hypothetical protein